MTKFRREWGVALFVATLVLLAPPQAGAELIKNLERPGEREFVRDLAHLLKPEDTEAIRAESEKLLDEKATPIIVVTIDSMEKHGGGDGMRIETFARLLFDQWQIGHAEINGQAWNTGILLLISKDDRKARIELGAGWARGKDAICKQIMDGQIIPRFKASDFSGGIRAGVGALDKMARGLELPKPVRPWWHHLLLPGLIVLMIFTGVSLARKGASGWAWVFWAAIFAMLGWFIFSFLKGSSGSGSGGGGSGSFGGGFSGGGGATGGW